MVYNVIVLLGREQFFVFVFLNRRQQDDILAFHLKIETTLLPFLILRHLPLQ